MNKFSIHIRFSVNNISLAKLVCAGSLESICKARISLEIMYFMWIYKMADISAYANLRV